MANIPVNDGDSFSVTPGDLIDTASAFSKVANDISTLETSLNNDGNQLIPEMSNVLSQSPDSLRRFFDHWHTAVSSLVDALNEVSSNLYDASTGYQDTENQVRNSFQKHHNNIQ